MSAAEAGAPDKLSLVVFSGDFDRVHYALVMAAAAVATNKPVTLFFTMGAARALVDWRTLPGAQADDDLRAKGLATFDELLDACVALGVTFMVCEMGLKALGIAPQALRADVPVTPGGVVTFLADASKNGAMLFI
ncbi:MAG TPA: DsrE/DsrF/DrsH-like family protein [Magnetospirillum sp.]|nr:DsrE/DsrF/DrsH-like family protein [Magnetospirillum sp.]